MGELSAEGFFAVIGIKAIDVLPRVAGVAVYRVSVIVREVTYTLDGVGLLVSRLGLMDYFSSGGGRQQGEEALTRKRGLRLKRGRLFCHNLARKVPQGDLGSSR